MVQSVLAQAEAVLAALQGLADVEAVLVDAAGNQLWSSRPGGALPAAPGQEGLLPCLQATAGHRSVVNPHPRAHPVCQGCPAADCHLATVVAIAAVDAASPAAGAIALGWRRKDAFGAGAADALLTLAGGLAAAITAHLVAELDRREAFRQTLQFTALADNLPDPVLLLDAAGAVTQANPAAAAVFGRRLPGVPVAELLHGPQVDWAEPRTSQIEARVAGSAEVLQVMLTPLSAAGGPGGTLLICRPPAPERTEPRAGGPRLYSFADIKGISPAIVQVRAMAERAASTDATVLIRGESGTGKEVFAQAIHSAGPRQSGPFVAVNCAAIPETLLESELFGYDEGAFTGARKGGKPGKFELAHGGSLFLDEVGDMPLLLQAKLLRVLQERVIERVGSNAVQPVDVRIIAASNRDLRALIERGQFREDLYYRLNVIPLEIPPLRQRRADLHLLIDHFLKKYGHLLGKEGCRLAAGVLNALHRYDWPGNVRELENTIQYMVSLTQGAMITPESLPPHLRAQADLPAPGPRQPPASAAPAAAAAPASGAGRRAQSDDAALIQELLRRHGSSTAGKRAVAAELGISLATLYRRLKALETEKITENFS